MSNAWLQAALDPDGFRRRFRANGDRSPAFGLSLLVDGQLVEYQRHAEGAGWPSLSGDGPWASPDTALLGALASQLSGHSDVAEKYELLAGSDHLSDDGRTVAAVLAGIALADGAQQELAVGALRTALLRSRDPLQRALLVCHLALRLAELGRPTDSVDALESVESWLGPQPDPLGALVRTVARRNLASFAFQAGRMDAFESNRQGEPDPLQQRAYLRALDGLDAYLDERFDRVAEDPSIQTFSFRSEDPVVGPALGALLRAEILADWSQVREARRRLGRIRLLQSVGSAERQPEAAFHLLRRAGDTKGLQAALRLYRREGPLPPLRHVGHEIAGMPWVASELVANLAIIAEAADVLDRETVDATAQRLAQNLVTLLAPVPSHRTEDAVLKAVGSVGRYCSPPEAASLSSAMRRLADAQWGPIVLQPLAQALAGLKVEGLAQTEVDAWRAFAAQFLSAGDDRLFVAQVAFRKFGAADGTDRAVALQGAWESRPELDVAAAMLDAGVPLGAEVAAKAAADAVATLNRIRAEAQAGRFGFGEYVDTASVLAAILAAGFERQAWSALVQFLTDPHVPGSKKLRTLDYLAANADRVPQEVRPALGGHVAAAPDLPFERNEMLEGAIVRLRIALDAIGESEVIGWLAARALREERAVRQEAARTGAAALAKWRDSALFVVLLGLSQDRAFEVRATAVRSLAQSTQAANSPLQLVVDARLRESLLDPGASVPLAVLAGLREATTHGVAVDDGLLALTARLSEEHLAHSVRRAAAQLLEAVERESRASELNQNG
jgi:hypothetical protein